MELKTAQSVEINEVHGSNLASPAERPVLVRVENLSKAFQTALGQLQLFQNLSFTICTGEMLAVVGASGSGKSTLLHILGALEAPSNGAVYCASTQVNALTANEAAAFRNREAGYVWQFHHLLPEFTAVENVAMPLLARGMRREAAMQIAMRWLDEVELADRATHRAGELSGGEQQRVALARALVTEPKLLLADEPTGDLDSGTAEMVFSLVKKLHHQHGLTSVIVTHNEALARRCTRVIRLQDGRAVEVSPLEI
jgi:lipoprotein-releasing system ATP-binding protein